MSNSSLYPKYANEVDRESAYELLTARHATTTAGQKRANQPSGPEPTMAEKILGNSVTKSVLRAGATAAAGAIVRSLFKTGGKKRR